MALILDEQKHKDYAEQVREFARTEVAPRVQEMMAEEINNDDSVSFELYQRVGDLGLFYGAVPERAGGLDGGMVNACILMEELARVSPGFALSVELYGNGISDSVHVMHGMSDEDAKAMVDASAAFYAGQMRSSAAVSHPEGQSNPIEWPISAVVDGDEYIVNGSACYVTNVRAEACTYIAKDEEGRTIGLSIPDGTPGFTHNDIDYKLGQAGNAGGTCYFDNVRVPIPEGEPYIFIPGSEAYYNVYTTFCAEALGAAEGIFDKTIEYCKTHMVGGKPMTESQVVAHRLCYLQARIYAMRCMVYDLAARVNADGENPSEDYNSTYGWRSQAAKVVCGELSSEIARECMQLLGEAAYNDPDIWHFFGDIEDYSIMDLSSDIIWDLMVRDYGIQKYDE